MKIGMDLDGVVVQWQGGWIETYNVWFAAEVEPEHATHWDSCLELTHFDGMGEFWAWVDDVPDFWFKLKPIPGALGGLRDLQLAGHQIEFITNRHGNNRDQTLDWITQHVPNGHRYVPNFVHNTNGESKTVVDCQVYVDDDPKVLADLNEKRRMAIRFEQPWNKPTPANRVPAPLVAKNWAEVVRIVEVMS